MKKKKNKFNEYLNKEDQKIIKDHKCENDSLICEFIRKDSIEGFIIEQHTTQQLQNFRINLRDK